MGFGRWLIALLALALGPYARADLTLRHTFTFHFASFVPPELETQVSQQLSATLPSETLVRIKGDRVYSSFGPLFAITDYRQNQITLLNPKTHQYATAPLGESFEKIAAAQPIPALPPEVERNLGDLSIDVQTHSPGLTGEVQGIRAEEELLAVSMNMAGTQGVASAMRLEMQIWVAQAGELLRVPALREWADYAGRAQRAFKPAEMIEKMFSRLPAMRDSLRAPLEELAKTNASLVLKLHAAVLIPALSQTLAFTGQTPDGFDPAGPLAEFQMDLADLSTAEIPDSVYAVPAGYRAAPLQDLVQALVQAPSPIPSAAPQPLR
ncbi:MAG TPA: hypothetical protein VGF16_08050 [Bryobacteraceae bacterium]|jgi:hypothetical protein